MNEKLILVIDDSQFLCTMLKKSLDSVGYNTLVAHTLEEGMQLFEQSRPDLLLLDINLPDTPGPKACKSIKANAQYANTSVILMSSSYEEYIKQQVNECGADGYIKKPFSPSSILRWVKENSKSLFNCDDFEEEEGNSKPYTLDDIDVMSRRDQSPKPVMPSRKDTPLLSGEGKTIVITDDSTFLCAILKDTLEKVGFKIHTFPNIRETGYFLKGNPTDLIFLDINLPDIAGDRACSIIKDSPKTKNIPIILISSAEKEQLHALTKSSGADGFLIKPFTPLNVLEWMKRNLSNLFAKSSEPLKSQHIQPSSHLVSPERDREANTTKDFDDQSRSVQSEKFSKVEAESYDGPSEDEIDILIKQLGSPLKEVRLDACYTLGEFKVNRATEDLMKMLYDNDEEIKGEAAWALGEIEDSRALQPILRLIHSKNNWLQDRAIEAVGKFGDHRAIPPLIEILKSRDSEMKVTAVKALASIPCKSAIEALEEALNDVDEEVAANATWALRKMNSPRG